MCAVAAAAPRAPRVGPGVALAAVEVGLLVQGLRGWGVALAQVAAEVSDVPAVLDVERGPFGSDPRHPMEVAHRGGQLVAHSSELPNPHGSSTVTGRPYR